MKTTLELPDELLIEAKTAAARRRTTLKALMEIALRRELYHQSTPSTDAGTFLELGPNEPPCLKARGANVTSKLVYQMLEAEGC